MRVENSLSHIHLFQHIKICWFYDEDQQQDRIVHFMLLQFYKFIRFTP